MFYPGNDGPNVGTGPGGHMSNCVYCVRKTGCQLSTPEVEGGLTGSIACQTKPTTCHNSYLYFYHTHQSAEKAAGTPS